MKLIGYKNGTGKESGRPYTMVTVLADCTPADNSCGTFGQTACTIFLPSDKVGTINENMLGKEFIPVYTANSFGKPTLVDFSVK